MRLHSIALTDYRGFTQGPVTFADTGVTIVEGPNEAGKSSLLEALELLLTTKATSKSQAVRDAQTVGRDTGPGVTITATTGPYSFEYTKRWLKGVRTELVVTAPVAEQWSGDAAHDRVERMLTETLDDDLWRAVRLLQGESLEQPTLAAITPLHRAMETASGDAAPAADHGGLLADVKAERDRYYTSRDVERGELAAAATAVTEAGEDLAEAQRNLDDLDHLVERHGEYERELLNLRSALGDARDERAATRRRARDLEELERRRASVTAERRETELRLDVARSALRTRRDLVAEAERRRTAEADARAAWERARDRDAASAEAAREAEALDESAQSEARRARIAWRDAEAKQAALRDAHAAADLAGRVERAATATRDLARIEAALAANTMTEEALNRLRDAHITARAMRDAAVSQAPVVRVEALDDSEVLVDGNPVRDDTEIEATGTVSVDVPGHARITVSPDRGSVERAAAASRAHEEYEGLLREHGVADLRAAQRERTTRHDLDSERSEATRSRDIALDGLTLEALTAERDAVRERAMSIDETTDPPPADDLRAAVETADDEAVAAREAAQRIRARRDGERRAAAAAQSEVEGAKAELASVRRRLETARGDVTDADLEASVAEAERQVGLVRQRVSEVEDAYREAGAAMIADQVERAERRVDDLGAKVRDHEAEVHALAGRLQSLGSQGWHDRRAEAQARLQDAERRRARLESRAEAAHLLHEVMDRHHRAAQQRYVGPFTGAIEALGRVVFDDDFGVQIDDDLRIVARTLRGSTVPFHSLSGGAREQLGLIGRLAAARLIDQTDGAPVVIDDALGFADAERRRRMAAVLSMVGRGAQIIVLTCEPERYRDVEAAATVRLDGGGGADTERTA